MAIDCESQTLGHLPIYPHGFSSLIAVLIQLYYHLGGLRQDEHARITCSFVDRCEISQPITSFSIIENLLRSARVRIYRPNLNRVEFLACKKDSIERIPCEALESLVFVMPDTPNVNLLQDVHFAAPGCGFDDRDGRVVPPGAPSLLSDRKHVVVHPCNTFWITKPGVQGINRPHEIATHCVFRENPWPPSDDPQAIGHVIIRHAAGLSDDSSQFYLLAELVAVEIPRAGIRRYACTQKHKHR